MVEGLIIRTEDEETVSGDADISRSIHLIPCAVSQSNQRLTIPRVASRVLFWFRFGSVPEYKLNIT